MGAGEEAENIEMSKGRGHGKEKKTRAKKNAPVEVRALMSDQGKKPGACAHAGRKS